MVSLIKGTGEYPTALAAFLPQFHPIPENDRWWGKDFTEWTHLDRARPWRKSHVVRKPSSELGRYSLIDADILEAQYESANKFGITGFAVWHYWFGNGRKLLQRPLDLVVKQSLNFRYALSWANHSWTDKSNGRMLMEQKYLGKKDYESFFFDTLKHFESDNYIKINERPVFLIYDPLAIPDLDLFQDTWNELALRQGIKTPFWIGDKLSTVDPIASKFDRVSNGFGFWSERKKLYVNWIKEKLRTKLGVSLTPQFYDYATVTSGSIPEWETDKFIPTVIAGWDTTPRHSKRGVVFQGYDPASFSNHLEQSYEFITRKMPTPPIVFLKSWNEWAEGNALEADEMHGEAYLEKYRDFALRVAALYP